MNADIKQMIAEKTEFLLADDGNNIDQEERLRAIEELRGLEMVQADSGKDAGAEKSGEQMSGCLYAVDFEPDGEPGFFLLEILVSATNRAFFPGPVTVTFVDRSTRTQE